MELETIKNSDPEIAVLVEQELERQRNTIELIASENIVSEAVMAAAGTVLTNKYAEGRPAKRFYNGCEVVDKIETLAQELRCDHHHTTVILDVIVECDERVQNHVTQLVSLVKDQQR